MRTFIVRPDDDQPYPALACYSDIFQMTESTQRMAMRFASYGYVVAAPEIYWRFEPPGTAIAFDDPGRDRGMADGLGPENHRRGLHRRARGLPARLWIGGTRITSTPLTARQRAVRRAHPAAHRAVHRIPASSDRRRRRF